MSILQEIFIHKRQEVAERMRELPIEALHHKLEDVPEAPDFIESLKKTGSDKPALIAEVKHKSPSKGVLRSPFDPYALAQTYRENGAAAVSVLTDEKYFGGKLDYLAGISTSFAGTLPTLRKDFIFSEYQVLEAAAAGASAVLLIAAMLSRRELAFLLEKAEDYGMSALVEAHTHAEVDAALEAGAALIGINNRDLHTFTVDIGTTLALRPHIPPTVTVVSESGISTAEHVRTLADAGVDAMLIGETLVVEQDPAVAIRKLRGAA